MDVIEKAKELSMAIMQDERCRRLQLAKVANDADGALSQLIGEFNLKKLALGQELKKAPPDEKKSAELQNELKAVYTKIMATPSMKEYAAAKREMDELLTHVNSIIQLAVSGEIDASGCAGDCSRCPGCH